MALHQSLVDLAELAPRCESLAAARGILEESQSLLRNALDHREDEVALASWFSRLVVDTVLSPALGELTAEVRLTGAAALGDATPTSTITWIGSNPELEDFFRSAGLNARSVDSTTAHRVDAGLAVGIDGESSLFSTAMELRPPALQLVNGLPDPDQEVDVARFLLEPIQAVARWAAPAPRPTPDRLAIGQERQLLSAEDGQSLTQAWAAGMALDLKNWADHVASTEIYFGDLPPLDRTAYGSACRMVAEVFTSLQARNA